MHLKICPLHKKFGVIVENINLDKVTKKNLYPEIRELFEEHSVLLFKNQKFSEKTHINLAKLFGPLENREAMAKNSPIPFEPKIPTKMARDVYSKKLICECLI